MASERTGGRILVDALRIHGIDTVFCVPGESYLAVVDALYDVQNDLHAIVCRQEGGAAFMAEATAKLTGRPGVCFVTRAPGACNGSNGLCTAFLDSTPMLYFIGQVPRDQRGREAFQELPYEQVFGAMTKWTAEIDDPGRIPELVARAFQVALSGRPGPVALALPEDMLEEPAAVEDALPYRIPAQRPGPDEVETARALLGAARKPVMVLGGTVWDEAGRAAAHAFAAANRLPVLCTFRRQGLFDNRHPSYAGDIGYTLAPQVGKLMDEADLLLVVGSRFGDVATKGYALGDLPAPGRTLIHVHPGAEEIGRVYQPDLGIVADPGRFLEAAAAMPPLDSSAWAGWCATAHAAWEADLAPQPCPGAVDMAAAMGALDAALPEDAIVTLGAGNYTGWINRYLPIAGARRLIGAANGTMGYGVPAAIAAKCAFPHRTVLGVSGDGDFLMNGQELATAVQYGLDPVYLVVDNGMYGTIRAHQENRYPGRVMATALQNPDFAALARSYGAHGETVRRTEEFAPALKRALGAGRAALIDIKIDPEAITTRATLTELRERALARRG